MRISPALRELVWQRATSRCEHCQMPEKFDPLPFQIDHVVARQHQGASTEENLALSCFECNVHKGPNIAGVDPESGNVVPLFNPRRDRWGEHFEWNGAELVGRTPIGKATVTVLSVNLPHRRAFREALAAEGVFPPKWPSLLESFPGGPLNIGLDVLRRERFSFQRRRLTARLIPSYLGVAILVVPPSSSGLRYESDHWGLLWNAEIQGARQGFPQNMPTITASSPCQPLPLSPLPGQ